MIQNTCNITHRLQRIYEVPINKENFAAAQAAVEE